VRSKAICKTYIQAAVFHKSLAPIRFVKPSSVRRMVGVYIGVSGSPTGVSIVSVKRLARDLWKEAWCGEGVAWRSPPRRAGVLECSVVSRVWSQ
jgi:hypothetical protein